MEIQDPKDFIHCELSKKASENKKFVYALLGIIPVLVVWAGTLVCMFCKTEAAAQFVSLATIVVSFVGAITTTLLTGEAVFSYKSMSTVAQVDTNDKEERIANINSTSNQNINENIKIDAPVDMYNNIITEPRIDPKDIDEETLNDYDRSSYNR